MADIGNEEYTKEELERMEREERRFAMEKELEQFKEEVREDAEKKEKRKAARKSLRSLIYFTLLILVVVGLIAYFIHWRESI